MRPTTRTTRDPVPTWTAWIGRPSAERPRRTCPGACPWDCPLTWPRAPARRRSRSATPAGDPRKAPELLLDVRDRHQLRVRAHTQEHPLVGSRPGHEEPAPVGRPGETSELSGSTEEHLAPEQHLARAFTRADRGQVVCPRPESCGRDSLEACRDRLAVPQDGNLVA